MLQTRGFIRHDPPADQILAVVSIDQRLPTEAWCWFVNIRRGNRQSHERELRIDSFIGRPISLPEHHGATLDRANAMVSLQRHGEGLRWGLRLVQVRQERCRVHIDGRRLRDSLAQAINFSQAPGRRSPPPLMENDLRPSTTCASGTESRSAGHQTPS